MDIMNLFLMGILLVKWQDGSQWEEIWFVELSDLESSVWSEVNKHMEAAVQGIFFLFWLWQLFQQEVPLFAAFSENSLVIFILVLKIFCNCWILLIWTFINDEELRYVFIICLLVMNNVWELTEGQIQCPVEQLLRTPIHSLWKAKICSHQRTSF